MNQNTDEVLSLDERAVLAASDIREAELLSEEFTPFISSSVARYSGGSFYTYREEMLSAAMLAFQEAINSYDASKGHFSPFVGAVIRRRILDCIRRVYKQSGQTVSYDSAGDAPNAQTQAIADASLAAYQRERSQVILAEEIEQYRAELACWGITMDSLVKASPKHAKLRELYRLAVKTVAENTAVMQTIQIKRYFPVKKVTELTGVPQKKIERARTFILASLIIITGDYDCLSEYIRQ